MKLAVRVWKVTVKHVVPHLLLSAFQTDIFLWRMTTLSKQIPSFFSSLPSLQHQSVELRRDEGLLGAAIQAALRQFS